MGIISTQQLLISNSSYSIYLSGSKRLDATPALLDAERAGLLPEVVLVREEDRLGADLLDERLDGLDLLDWARDGLAVGAAGGRPAGLEVEHVLAAAQLSEDLHLLLGEGAALLGGDFSVEEGVDVGADDVDDGAEHLGVLLPDVERLGGGDVALVAGLAEGLLGGGDEVGEGAGVGAAAEDGLVADDDEVDDVPLAPLDGLGDLLAGDVDAAGGDEDADDHVEPVLLAGAADGLQGVAVGGVDADGGEAGSLDGGDAVVDLTLRHALAVLSVGGEGDAPLVASADGESGLAGLRSGSGSAGLGDGGLRWLGGSRRRSDGRSRGSGSSSRADIDVIGLDDGHGLAGAGVGAGGELDGSGIDQDGALGDAGGRGGDGVGARGRADISGSLDDAGLGRTDRLDGRNRAGHSGSGLDDGGDTAVGVLTGAESRAGGAADGGLAGDDDGGRLDGVGAGRREDRDDGRGQLDLGRRGRRRRRLGGDGDGHGGGAGGRDGGGRLGGGLREHYAIRHSVPWRTDSAEYLLVAGPYSVMTLVVHPQVCAGASRLWKTSWP